MCRDCDIQQGSGLKLAGQGWRSGLGGTLLGLGALGAAGNMANDLPSAIIGGAVLSGLGGYLIHKDRLKTGSGYQLGSGKGHELFQKKLLQAGRKLYKAKHGKSLTNDEIANYFKQHQHKKIHAKDLFGHQWQEAGDKLIGILNQHKGEGIFKDIGRYAKGAIKKVEKSGIYKKAKKYRDKAVDKLIDFAQGRTRLKPSDIANYTASAVGLAGMASAFIPGVDLISVPAASAAALGIKSAGLALKTSGRGLSPAGGGWEEFMDMSELGLDGMEDPSKIGEVISKLASSAGPELSKTKLGIAIGLTGAALAGAYTLYRKLRKKGSGLVLAGGAMQPDIPAKYVKFMKNNPDEALRIIKNIQQGPSGEGLIKKGILAGTALALYKYLKNNPDKVLWLANRMNSFLSGSGMEASGSGKIMRDDIPTMPIRKSITLTGQGKQKRRGSKREVWNGTAHHTTSGLTKDDLMKNKRGKIVSKKQHAAGKKAYERNNLKQYENSFNK